MHVSFDCFVCMFHHYFVWFTFVQDMFSKHIGTTFMLTNFKSMCVPSKDLLLALLSMVSCVFGLFDVEIINLIYPAMSDLCILSQYYG